MKKMTMMLIRKNLRCLYRLPFLSIFSKTVTAAPTRRKRRRRRRERRIISTQRRRRRRRTTTSRKCSDSFTFDLLLNLFASSDFSFASLVGGRNPLVPPTLHPQPHVVLSEGRSERLRVMSDHRSLSKIGSKSGIIMKPSFERLPKVE